MAVAVPQAPRTTSDPLVLSALTDHANTLQPSANNLRSPVLPVQGSPAMATNAMSKKAKSKKAADPNETSKLLAAKISQLEQDAAGEKDQEAEIGASICFIGRYVNEK
jgi:hypothetical protein